MKKGDKGDKTSKLEEIKSSQQYFRRLKKLLKDKNQKGISIRLLACPTQFGSDNQYAPFNRYFQTKKNIVKSLSDEEIQQTLKQIMDEAKVTSQTFYLKEKFIFYNYKIVFQDQRSFLEQMDLHPEGVLVDDEFMKFASSNAKMILQQAIRNRQIIAVRSKFYDKPKTRDENYLGYYLFPFPPQMKGSRKQLFFSQNKFDIKSSSQKDKQYQKFKKSYETKTSMFRKEFQNICSQNANKANQQQKKDKNEDLKGEKSQKDWVFCNKQSIPNFQKQVQQWSKNRKK